MRSNKGSLGKLGDSGNLELGAYLDWSKGDFSSFRKNARSVKSLSGSFKL